MIIKIKMPDSLALKTVFDIVKKTEYEARLVGGFVRDSLLNKNVGDIDIAITCDPQTTINIFETAGYKVIPTGVEYGTVTVVIDDECFEITSLRADVETDGRRAVVSYTQDWKVDAQRRDFTVNALYADDTGLIYDFVGGVDDVKTKTLRFVGNADIRVAEDALRILRYYRFMVQLGFMSVDCDSALACKNGAKFIKNLSFERVGMEMKKMFSMPNDPTEIIDEMVRAGIFTNILPFPIKAGLPFMNKPVSQATNPLLKCIVLAGLEYKNVKTLATLWKFSNADIKYMCSVISVYNDRAFVPALCHRFAYFNGIKAVLGACALKEASGIGGYERVADILEKWVRPNFPLSGKDLMLVGMEASPAMGALLKAVEMWWVDNAFKPRMQDCLIFAKQRMNIKR